MIQNAFQVEELLQTNNMGAKAQVGYDLTLKKVKRIKGGSVSVDKTSVKDYEDVMPFSSSDGTKFYYELEPGTYSLTFHQGVKLPHNRTAFIRHRSSVLRCGGIITSGIYDPGFEVDEMGAVLVATSPITIEIGARVAQIIVMENTPAELYDGQWQKQKDLK